MRRAAFWRGFGRGMTFTGWWCYVASLLAVLIVGPEMPLLVGAIASVVYVTLGIWIHFFAVVATDA